MSHAYTKGSPIANIKAFIKVQRTKEDDEDMPIKLLIDSGSEINSISHQAFNAFKNHLDYSETPACAEIIKFGNGQRGRTANFKIVTRNLGFMRKASYQVKITWELLPGDSYSFLLGWNSIQELKVQLGYEGDVTVLSLGHPLSHHLEMFKSRKGVLVAGENMKARKCGLMEVMMEVKEKEGEKFIPLEINPGSRIHLEYDHKDRIYEDVLLASQTPGEISQKGEFCVTTMFKEAGREITKGEPIQEIEIEEIKRGEEGMEKMEKILKEGFEGKELAIMTQMEPKSILKKKSVNWPKKRSAELRQGGNEQQRKLNFKLFKLNLILKNLREQEKINTESSKELEKLMEEEEVEAPSRKILEEIKEAVSTTGISAIQLKLQQEMGNPEWTPTRHFAICYQLTEIRAHRLLLMEPLTAVNERTASRSRESIMNIMFEDKKVLEERARKEATDWPEPVKAGERKFEDLRKHMGDPIAFEWMISEEEIEDKYIAKEDKEAWGKFKELCQDKGWCQHQQEHFSLPHHEDLSLLGNWEQNEDLVLKILAANFTKIEKHEAFDEKKFGLLKFRLMATFFKYRESISLHKTDSNHLSWSLFSVDCPTLPSMPETLLAKTPKCSEEQLVNLFTYLWKKLKEKKLARALYPLSHTSGVYLIDKRNISTPRKEKESSSKIEAPMKIANDLGTEDEGVFHVKNHLKKYTRFEELERKLAESAHQAKKRIANIALENRISEEEMLEEVPKGKWPAVKENNPVKEIGVKEKVVNTIEKVQEEEEDQTSHKRKSVRFNKFVAYKEPDEITKVDEEENDPHSLIGRFGENWFQIFQSPKDCRDFITRTAWQGISNKYRAKLRENQKLNHHESKKEPSTKKPKFIMEAFCTARATDSTEVKKAKEGSQPLLKNLKSMELQESNPFGTAFLDIKDQPVEYSAVLTDTIQQFIADQNKEEKLVNTIGRKQAHESWSRGPPTNMKECLKVAEQLQQFIHIKEFEGANKGHSNVISALQETSAQLRSWKKQKPAVSPHDQALKLLGTICQMINDTVGASRLERARAEDTLRVLQNQGKVPGHMIGHHLDTRVGEETLFSGLEANTYMWSIIAKVFHNFLLIKGRLWGDRFVPTDLKLIGTPHQDSSQGCVTLVYEENQGRFLKGSMSLDINQTAVEVAKRHRTKGIETLKLLAEECRFRKESNENLRTDLREAFVAPGIAQPNGLRDLELKPRDRFNFLPEAKKKSAESRVISSCVEINRHYVKLANDQPLPGVVQECIESGVRFVSVDITDYFSTIPLTWNTAQYLGLTSQLGEFIPKTATQGWVNSPSVAGPPGWALRQNMDKLHIPDWEIEDLKCQKHVRRAAAVTNLDDHLIAIKPSEITSGEEVETVNQLISVLIIFEQFLTNTMKVGNSGPLKIKADKTNLGGKYITYLGETVGNGLRSINLKNYKKLAKPVDELKTFKDVLSVISLLNYFNKYIRGSANNLARIRELIGSHPKDMVIDWSAQRHETLRNLLEEAIRNVNQAPALWILDNVKRKEDIGKLGLFHDSSKYYLGFILAVEVELKKLKQWIPCAFGSASLNPTQFNTPHYLKEALSLLFALKECKTQLRGLHSYPLDVFGDNSIVHNWMEKLPAKLQEGNNERLESICGEITEQLAQTRCVEINFKFRKSEQNISDGQSRGLAALAKQCTSTSQKTPEEFKLGVMGKEECGLPELKLVEKRKIEDGREINVMALDVSDYTEESKNMDQFLDHINSQGNDWFKVEDDQEKELTRILGSASKKEVKFNLEEARESKNDLNYTVMNTITTSKGKGSGQSQPKSTINRNGNTWTLNPETEDWKFIQEKVMEDLLITLETHEGEQNIHGFVTLLVGPVTPMKRLWGKESEHQLMRAEKEGEHANKFSSFYEIGKKGSGILSHLPMKTLNWQKLVPQLRIMKKDVLQEIGERSRIHCVKGIQLIVTTQAVTLSDILRAGDELKNARLNRKGNHEWDHLHKQMEWKILVPKQMKVDPFCTIRLIKRRQTKEFKLDASEGPEEFWSRLNRESRNWIGENVEEVWIRNQKLSKNDWSFIELLMFCFPLIEFGI